LFNCSTPNFPRYFIHPENNGECKICLNYFEKKHLILFCNKNPCQSFICRNCVQSILKQLQRGKIISKKNIFCPFCVRPSDTLFMSYFGVNYYQQILNCNSEHFGICKCGIIEEVTLHTECTVNDTNQGTF
jgi:hypothetical protein